MTLQQIEPHTMDKGVELGCPSCVWVSKQKKVTPPIESPEENKKPSCPYCHIYSYLGHLRSCTAPKEPCLEGAECKCEQDVDQECYCDASDTPTLPLIEETMKEFEKIIGIIPDRAIMEQYGKEFCVMCGRPTANDKTVIELRNLLRSTSLTMYEKGREDAIKQVEERVSELLKTPAYNKDQSYDRAIEEVLSTLSAVKEILSANK